MPDYVLFDAYGDGPSDETFLGRLTQEQISILGKNAYLGLIEGEAELYAALDLHHSDGGETAGYVVEHVCGSGARNIVKICRSWEQTIEILEENEAQNHFDDAISLEARRLVRIVDFENERVESPDDGYVLVLNRDSVVYGPQRRLFSTPEAAEDYARAVQIPLDRLEVARAVSPFNQYENEGGIFMGYIIEHQSVDGEVHRWDGFHSYGDVCRFLSCNNGLNLKYRKLIFEKSLDEVIAEEESQTTTLSPSP